MLARLALCFLLNTCLFSLNAQASLLDQSSIGNNDDFLPVEEAYQLALDFEDQQLILIWQPADGYFLYRHGFQHEWLIDGQAVNVEADLARGEEKEDEYFGKVETYHQQVIIRLDLPAGTQPILFSASAQGCADAGLCYPPYHLYFQIDPQARQAQAIDAATYQHAKQAAPTKTDGDDKKTAPAPNAPAHSLLLILLAAFLGGMILNLMPCVLPVLSMKVMQLARPHDNRTSQLHGLAYMAGVLISFIGIAAIMLGLRASGNAVGWGFQLQQPWFVASMVYLFFMLALSMIGLFHIGQRWMGMGQELTQRQGIQGAFFTGVLAVAVASPCTAPFMGSALGYAVTESGPAALGIFAVLGFGMALPMTLISFIPAAGRLLPKPGLWMERLKQFFAFPLFATATWLLWVLGNQAGTTAMAIILLGCIALSFALWSFNGGHTVTRVLGFISLLAAITLPFSDQLQQQPENRAERHEAYSTARLAELRRSGQAVFVDLTADWCITCLANEKSTLETDTVQQAFRDAGIVYLVGDWTHFNPEISALLSEYQRSGIPLYLLFPPVADAPAMILPQILSKDIVLDAIATNK